ncbi:hypothetical protein P3T36_001672 [Kitasatospora sp. MAP12-15]|uniref:hypothetical protein n=1 Tax=unclassified Kitasatospora TaxID=2633591 RepID=UPI002474519C|nr:hypothetical protein [Kitasatospora sp. MAP12-44]MDH6113449.1 hypothetical protein [Kitasatospora sp. MAP12-44]
MGDYERSAQPTSDAQLLLHTDPPFDGLLPGERLLWTGRPTGVRWLTLENAFALIPLLALLPLAAAPRDTAGSIMLAVWSVLALALGWQALIRVPQLARAEVYRITDRRALTTRAGLTCSAWLDQLPPPLRRGTDLRFDGRRRDPLMQQQAARTDIALLPVFRRLADADPAHAVALEAHFRLPELPPLPAPTGAQRVPVPAAVALAPGEQVLWSGRPESVRWWYDAADVGRSVFGCVFFVLGAAVGVLAGVGAWPVLVFLLPLGGYQAIGRVLLRRARIMRSSYVLTDHRLVVCWRLLSTVVIDEPLTALLPPVRDGDDVFTARADRRRRGRNDRVAADWPAAPRQPPKLLGLPDPAEAAEAIALAQSAARRPPVNDALLHRR